MDADNDFVKVFFHLEQDEDGYPPVATESLWAKRVPEGGYQLDNVPFYAKGVSWNDIVEAQVDDEGALYFTKVIRPSGHSTIRVMIFNEAEVSPLRKELEKLGCDSERDYVPQLISVDIPPAVDIRNVWNLLEQGLNSDKLEYEDACIQHATR